MQSKSELETKNVEKPLPSSQLRQPPPNTEVLPANVVGSPGQKKTNSFPVDPNQDVLSWLSVLFCDFPSLRFVTLISCSMTLPSFTMNHMFFFLILSRWLQFCFHEAHVFQPWLTFLLLWLSRHYLIVQDYVVSQSDQTLNATVVTHTHITATKQSWVTSISISHESFALSMMQFRSESANGT